MLTAATLIRQVLELPDVDYSDAEYFEDCVEPELNVIAELLEEYRQRWGKELATPSVADSPDAGVITNEPPPALTDEELVKRLEEEE